jgi:hypothetical protein
MPSLAVEPSHFTRDLGQCGGAQPGVDAAESGGQAGEGCDRGQDAHEAARSASGSGPAYVFLASPQWSSYITGEILPIIGATAAGEVRCLAGNKPTAPVSAYRRGQYRERAPMSASTSVTLSCACPFWTAQTRTLRLQLLAFGSSPFFPTHSVTRRASFRA